MAPRTLARARRTAAGLALAVVAAVPAEAAIYNVGPGGAGAGCEASTVEAAVALAAATGVADEIRVVNTQTFNLPAGLHLTDWGPTNHGALILSGGWASCSATTPTINRSTIAYGGASPVIEIDTTGANSSQVTLQTLTLRDSSGRGLFVQGDSTVDLFRVLVQLNDGGGLWVDGGAEVYLDPATSVLDNGPAPQGGGIRCLGAGTVVLVDGTIRYNRSSADGGGIHADGGCEVVVGTASVDDNEALAGDGGGIFAAGGALVSLFRSSVARNEAGSLGGGLAAVGAGAQVLIAAAQVLDNLSGSAAAGLYVGEGASISVGGSSCSTGFCPTLLSRNELLPGAHNGAAAMAASGGTLVLRQTEVRANEVPDAEPFGSVFYAESGGAIRTESVVVAGNLGADRVFWVTAGGEARVAFTTVARNRYYNNSSVLTEARGVVASGVGTETRALSSIFHPTAGFTIGAEVAAQFDCLLVGSLTGLPATATETYLMDPDYDDLAIGDLHVGSGSPAVDFCDTLVTPPTVAALNGRARGHDLFWNPDGTPGPPGANSVQDIGAYEYWELFADDFETGDSSRWTSTQP